MNELYHYGMPRRSGRYPYGSGSRPFQSLTKMQIKGINKKKELAKSVGRKLTKKEAMSKNEDDQNGLTMKKGQKVQHITGVEFKKLRKGQLYVTADEYDNVLYEAFLSLNLKNKGYNPAKVSLTLKEDLNVPSAKQQREIFDNLVKQHGESIESDIKDWLSSKGKNTSLKDAKNDPEKLYDLFMNSLEKPSDSQGIFYSELKSLGFNGVLDEHDITGSWMQGKKPIIIMDAMNTVGDLKISQVNTERIVDAMDKWLKMKE